jgi:hypothetical protein
METHGKVDWVKVNNTTGADFALFSVSPAGGGGGELFFIWFTAALRTTPSVTDRLLWTSQLALVRDARTANLPIIVFHDDTSDFVRSVEIGVA